MGSCTLAAHQLLEYTKPRWTEGFTNSYVTLYCCVKMRLQEPITRPHGRLRSINVCACDKTFLSTLKRGGGQTTFLNGMMTTTVTGQVGKTLSRESEGRGRESALSLSFMFISEGREGFFSHFLWRPLFLSSFLWLVNLREGGINVEGNINSEQCWVFDSTYEEVAWLGCLVGKGRLLTLG